MANQKVLLNDVAYDVIKDIVSLYAPAAVTLYAGLAVLWQWPNTENVIASAGLILTFLGVVFKVSNVQYNRTEARYDGDVLADVEGSFIVQMNDPVDLDKKNELILKVKTPPNSSSQI